LGRLGEVDCNFDAAAEVLDDAEVWFSIDVGIRRTGGGLLGRPLRPRRPRQWIKSDGKSRQIFH
jgi:hypothetical protein